MKKTKQGTQEHRDHNAEMDDRRARYRERAASVRPFHPAMLDHRTGKSKFIPAGPHKNLKPGNR